MGESPRWHENRLWCSNWNAQAILALDLHSTSEVVLRTSFGLLFIVAAEWRRMDNIAEVARARTGLVLAFDAPAPGVGWP
jgi:hypothetical protein